MSRAADDEIEALIGAARHEITLARSYAKEAHIVALGNMYEELADFIEELTNALESLYYESSADHDV